MSLQHFLQGLQVLKSLLQGCDIDGFHRFFTTISTKSTNSGSLQKCLMSISESVLVLYVAI